MHKVFISYHHERDQNHKNELVKLGDRNGLFIDMSVDTSDISDCLSTPIRKYNDEWNENASLTSSRRIREILTRSQCGSRSSAVSRGERSAAYVTVLMNPRT